MIDKDNKREYMWKYNREYQRKLRAGDKTVTGNGQEYLIDMLDWRAIPGYDGYLASKCGYILSQQRVVDRSDGRLHTVPSKVLKNWLSPKGHLKVSLCVKGYKFYRFVHRLVYMAWIGKIPDGLVVDHIDEDKLNNHLDNLQLLSNGQNVFKGRVEAKQKLYEEGYAKGYAQALIDIKGCV